MVKEGYKKTKYGLIPDSWDFLQLKDIAKVNMGSSPPSSTYNEDGDGLPFFQGNAEFGSIYPEENQWCTEPQKVADKGNILISVRAPVGDINIAPYKCCIGRGLAAIEGEETSNKFIYYYLKQFNPKLQSYSQGSTFSSINKKVLETFFVNYPPLLEQNKIASILSTVDKSIEKTNEVIEKTKELKKGLMQELLTIGIGHSEFKEVRIGAKTFKIPEIWELKNVGSLFKLVNGRAFKTDEWADDGLQIIRIQDLRENANAETNYCNFEVKDKYYVYNNDLLFCWAGNIKTSLGAYIWNKDKAVLNQHIYNMKPKTNLSKSYYKFLINKFLPLLKNYTGGSAGQVHITKGDFKTFDVPVPPLKEQKKIASILSSVDAKIQKEEEYKAKLEHLKKGLMQKLLTGEIRVNTDMEV